MTCSVQMYRIRIGMHNQCRKFFGKKIHCLPKLNYMYLKFCLTAAVMMSSSFIMVLWIFMTQFNFLPETYKSSTVSSKICQYNFWDPSLTLSMCLNLSCWLTNLEQNKMAHILYGLSTYDFHTRSYPG